jgi:hypothetical protein
MQGKVSEISGSILVLSVIWHVTLEKSHPSLSFNVES